MLSKRTGPSSLVARVMVPVIAFLAVWVPRPSLASAVADCSSGWTVVDSPNNGTLTSDLYGMSALSATDAWAVGYWRMNPPRDVTLGMHWDGTAWRIVSTPSF